MAGPIILSAVLTATNADILQGTRLQTVPRGGIMLFEFLSDEALAANNYVLTIQMPNGDTPANGILVPGSNPSLEGVMDERQKLVISRPVTQGGHVVVAATLTGAANLMYRITYQPANV